MSGTKNEEPDNDVTSDPALDGGQSTDWSSEGGATTEGPATDSEGNDGD